MGTPCPARSSCSSSTFSALSQRATPQPSRLAASRSTAGSRTANGIGSGGDTPAPGGGGRGRGQAEPFGVEAHGGIQVPYLEGDKVRSGDRHGYCSLVVLS